MGIGVSHDLLVKAIRGDLAAIWADGTGMNTGTNKKKQKKRSNNEMPNLGDSKNRKTHPMARGLIDYFPDALAAVANVSHVGNQQHNPGEEMHWDREKSKDDADCIIRHMMDRGKIDTDGTRHSSKIAWRALAQLQRELEQATFENNGLSLPVVQPHLSATVTVSGGSITPSTIILSPGKIEETAGKARSLNQTGFDMTKARSLPQRGYGVNEPNKTTFYIAGPMRSKDFYNFPAFDNAAELGRKLGYTIISPAEIDRATGLDPIKDWDHAKATVDAWTEDDLKDVVRRDITAILSLSKAKGDGLAVLPHWHLSTGAKAEVALAHWLGLRVVSATDFRSIPGV